MPQIFIFLRWDADIRLRIYRDGDACMARECVHSLNLARRPAQLAGPPDRTAEIDVGRRRSNDRCRDIQLQSAADRWTGSGWPPDSRGRAGKCSWWWRAFPSRGARASRIQCHRKRVRAQAMDWWYACIASVMTQRAPTPSSWRTAPIPPLLIPAVRTDLSLFGGSEN